MRYHTCEAIRGSLFLSFILLLYMYTPLFSTNDGQSHPRSNDSEVLFKGKNDDSNDGRNGGFLHKLSVPHDLNQIDRNAKKNSQLDRKILENAVKLKQSHSGIEENKNNYDYEFDINSDLRKTELSDIFISVKTTKKFHKSRLSILLDTWVALARNETYFITDGKDEEFHNKTNGHLIDTNCTAGHDRVSLCCKMSFEFDSYYASNKRWFCHVDDDTYVNIPELVGLLQKYNHTADWYLGKPSRKQPMRDKNPDSPRNRTAFWFATGGAGICFSRSLAVKMMPYAAGGKFKTTCARIRRADDSTIGYIVYNLLHKELTVVHQLHSHIETLNRIKSQNFDKQITLSYNIKHKNTVDILSISGVNDPSRLCAVHFQLFPNLKGCPETNG